MKWWILRVVYVWIIALEIGVIRYAVPAKKPPHRTITVSYVVDVPDAALITDRYTDEAVRVMKLIRAGTEGQIFMTFSPRGHYVTRRGLDFGDLGFVTEDGQWSSFELIPPPRYER